MRKSVLTGVVAFACLSSSCLAAEYFVATKGRDANPGSKARPWKTVARAVKRAKPGDTVILRRGIYRAARFDLGPAGRKSRSKTVFKAFGGERVILTAPNGKPPGFALRDYVRVEGLWIGGVWTRGKGAQVFAVGGSPVGRGKELVACTIFGYGSGILVGSSQDLLIQGCRIVHCGDGRFAHGIYLSGGYTKGAMTQHVIVDDNTFVAGEGYAIHGWHNPHSCIITRNFVSGYFWDLVMSGSDHLIAHNTLWRNTGQKGREPGWNAWLPAKRVILVNNILNSGIPVYGGLGTGGVVSHNAYLVGPPHAADAKPIDLREGQADAKTRAAIEKWSSRIDKAVKQIDGTFNKPVEKLLTEKGVEQAFDVLKSSPPKVGGLGGAGKDVGFSAKAGSSSIGRTVAAPADMWKTFDTLELKHFNNSGEKTKRRIPPKKR